MEYRPSFSNFSFWMFTMKLRERDLDGRHHGLSVFIHEIQLELVLAFLAFAEGHPNGDGALRVNRRQLRCIDGVEGAKDVQLPAVVRGRIAKYRNLNVHNVSEA
jgi:hypothetical protein